MSRLVNSALMTAKDISKLEFIFYVDQDDFTFPIHLLKGKIKVINGPRTWLSVAYNNILLHCTGEIIMYCGDDVVFKTKHWDEFIKLEFDQVADKICLVYANDGVNQSQSIARHGFIHRQWFDSTGWAFPSLRMLPIDLWMTDLATQVGRLRYLEKVVIEHVHFRQGKKAKLDQTYQDANDRAKSWNSLITFSNLKYDRRIDYVLLCEAIKIRPKTTFSYILGNFILFFLSTERDSSSTRRFRTLSNYEILKLVTRKIKHLMKN